MKTAEEKDTKKKENVKKVEKAPKKENVQKESSMTLIILLAVIIALGLGIPIGNKKMHDNRGDLRTPFSTEEALQMDYKDVNTKLKNAGFTNIEVKKKDDLVIGWTIKDGSVESVTINGMDTYDKGEWVPVDSKVVLIYHTFRNKRN